MSGSVSVIIPALNEAARIGATIDSARAAGASEIIVCDAGSYDGTATIAADHGAALLSCEPMRARQLNQGAAAARGETLLFLHADTLLPPDAANAAAIALSQGIVFGGFRLRFAEDAWKLRCAEAMINLRTSFTRCPWGDQAQFIRRDRFLASGGYAEIPLMEDYEMAIRMKREGRTAVLPMSVTTSGRRFLKKGVLRTAAMNWRIIAAYRLGADPAELARLYRG